MAFTSGNYSSATKDANGFWLTDTGYTSTQNTSTNSSSFSDGLTLRHASSGMFSQWTLTRWLRVQYTVDGGSTQTKYLVASTSGQLSMPNTSLSLGSGTVTIPHNSDGTQTITLTGYCDANTNATYVPVNTTASRTITLPSISVTPAPTAPTSLSATSNSSSGITVSWSGATGSISSYEIFYSTSSLSVPGTPQITEIPSSSSSYIDTTATADQSRYYWVRARGSGGVSSWYPGSSQGGAGGIMPTAYTVNFTNSYGSNGSSTQTVLNNYSTTFPNPGTRSGYTFNGWNNNTSYYAGANTPSITGNTTYSADSGWVVLAPGFNDETVTPQLVINQTMQSTANNSVSATNTTSYSLEYAGTGLNATTWLSINASTGALSGSTNVPGVYTFRVKATGTITSTYSNTITVTVVYPGKRINSTLGQSAFVNAKRYDANNGWTALTQMKKFIGVGQPGADANGWTNLSN